MTLTKAQFDKTYSLPEQIEIKDNVIKNCQKCLDDALVEKARWMKLMNHIIARRRRILRKAQTEKKKLEE